MTMLKMLQINIKMVAAVSVVVAHQDNASLMSAE
jgi:hypothetical protein